MLRWLRVWCWFFYWTYFRSRKALANHLQVQEVSWSGKTMPEDEVQQHVNDIKGWVWY